MRVRSFRPSPLPPLSSLLLTSLFNSILFENIQLHTNQIPKIHCDCLNGLQGNNKYSHKARHLNLQKKLKEKNFFKKIFPLHCIWNCMWLCVVLFVVYKYFFIVIVAVAVSFYFIIAWDVKHICTAARIYQ